MSRRLILAATAALLALVPPGTFAGETRTFVEVRFRGREDLLALGAGGMDIAGIDWAGGTVGIIARPEDLGKLSGLGLAWRVRGEREDARPVPAGLAGYTDPAEVEAFLDRVEAEHPDLARKVLLAEGLPGGHRVWAMKLTADVGGEHDRPSFVLDAQHHAREVMTTEIALDMIEYLASRYARDDRVRRWLDNIVVWVVPTVNPDGSAHVFAVDEWWRKNRDPACSDDPGLWGVDLNRNYPAGWGACPGGSSGFCGDADYRGPFPSSEPETLGMVALMGEARAPFSLSYHSYGELILYPYGCRDATEREALDEVARALGAVLRNDDGVPGRYAVGPGRDLYPTDGTSDETQYADYGTASFVIEVNRHGGFQPDYATWRDLTVRRQRAAWKFLLDRTLDTPSIQGHVTDWATGLPLPARVDLEEVPLAAGEQPRRADDRGRYFRLARAGRVYHATFSYPGYHPQTFVVRVGEGKSLLDVRLSADHPFLVGRVVARRDPFRLVVRGAGFRPGCAVKIDGNPVPVTSFAGPTRLVARGGRVLRAMLPLGVPVTVTVEDASGASNAFGYERY